TPNPDSVTCDLAAGIAPGQANDQVIKYSGIVTATAARPLQNKADLSGGGDNNADNNSATSTTNVQTANLVLTKTAAPDSVSVGEPITWTIRIHNNGPGNAVGTTLTDVLLPTITPGNLTAPNSAHCSLTDQTLTCAPDAMAAGGSDIVIRLTGTPKG